MGSFSRRYLIKNFLFTRKSFRMKTISKCTELLFELVTTKCRRLCSWSGAKSLEGGNSISRLSKLENQSRYMFSKGRRKNTTSSNDRQWSRSNISPTFVCKYLSGPRANSVRISPPQRIELGSEAARKKGLLIVVTDLNSHDRWRFALVVI